MSKKKSFSGSTTMTLKDFHGGSIPSDLHLPSAPGVSVRPPDRLGSWGPAAIGSGGGIRPDYHRPRPGSAGGARGSGFGDERGPSFLSTPAHIGRHFDEDERKPFDANSAPRRPAAAVADPVRSSPVPSRSDPKRPISSPVTHPVGSTPPNAWGLRKEAVIDQPPPSATILSGPAAASRFAQASAIEKISSGRWQSKPPAPSPDVEVIRFQESMEGLGRSFGESVRVVDEAKTRNLAGFYSDQERARSPVQKEVKEKSAAGFYSDQERARSPLHQEVKEKSVAGFYSDQERARSPLQQELKDRSAAGFYSNVARPVSNEGRFGGSQLQHQGVAARPVSNEGRFGGSPLQHQGAATVDVGERPKLKLLPRSKPMDPNESWALEEKQEYQPSVDPVLMENAHEMHGSKNMQRPGSAGADAGGRVIERPRLNLKPRSLPVEQLDETAERERKTVFGGARPRELVLKERGIDNIGATNLEVAMPANRVKNDIPKTDMKPEPAVTTIRRGERADSFPLEERSGRDLERKDYRTDLEKVDAQRTSWRTDNRRNTREIEKPVERRQDPDTWRKPVEQPKPEVPGPGPRHGRAASALELAQAFSRSVSDARSDNRFPSQKSLPGRPQVPFSRLTDTREFYPGPNQRHINGY